MITYPYMCIYSHILIHNENMLRITSYPVAQSQKGRKASFRLFGVFENVLEGRGDGLKASVYLLYFQVSIAGQRARWES